MAVATKRCHTTTQKNGEPASDSSTPLIALVGHPNVGKSVVFHRLTGAYVTASNYPGTTVEVTYGATDIEDERYRVVDTPGMYSVLPSSEDERVAQQIVFEQNPDVVVHVVDAKNLERMLPLTLQLLEAGLPVVVALNIMDEADRRGVAIDLDGLQQDLGVPVVSTVATRAEGIDELRKAIGRAGSNNDNLRVDYPPAIEDAIEEISGFVRDDVTLAPRAGALLVLQDHPDAPALLEPNSRTNVTELSAEIRARSADPLSYRISTARQHQAAVIAEKTVRTTGKPDEPPLEDRLSDFLINPWTGIPVLLAVLYFGLYKFVGQFGAGTVVDFIEGAIFEAYVNPWVEQVTREFVPWVLLQDLIAGEYGIITLGIRYGVAIILPVVGFFFLVFAILEDSGYLPRLALLVDRLFKKIGLSGRGVIPIVLGLGCDTMATMVTRTLSTTRERVISTMLLALAVPCSAQLGVLLALLEGHPAGLGIWAGVVFATFLATGFLAARLLPGSPPRFLMELPPLRLPTLGNVLTKTASRVQWYMTEVIPLFVLASVLIWLGQLTGLFQWSIEVLSHPAQWVGLPAETAESFLFGFFRRDYGAAGLYDLNKQGLLSGNQLVIATVALTLFVPCIAQFLIAIKERGLKWGLAIPALAVAVSLGTAFALNYILTITGVQL